MGGADAPLVVQQLVGRLASVDSLWIAARVRLDAILSVDVKLCDLVTFAFVASHLFSAGGRQSSAVTELLHIIEMLEELHTEVHGTIH